MTGIQLQEVNKIWLKARAEQARIKNRGVKTTCPFPYYNYEPDTAKRNLEKIQVECGYGKGTWCKICVHHARHQTQQRYNRETYVDKKKIIFRGYHETGLAYNLRRKPNPVEVTNPDGLAMMMEK